MRKLALAALFLILVGPLAITYSSPGSVTTSTLEIVGQSVLGYCSTVASFGDVTYAGFGSAIVALDTTDPASPQVVGRAFVPNCFDGKLSLSGNTLFVSRDIYGLGVFDVTERLQPSHLCTYARLDPGLDPNDIDNNHYAGGTEAAGGYLYWANGNYEGKGLTILRADPSGPDCLDMVGYYKVPLSDPSISFAYSVHVRGDRAYLCTRESGVWVFDVSDPSHPVPLSRIVSPGCSQTNNFAIDMTTSPDGRWGFVADGPSGLKVIDLSTNEVIPYAPPAPGCNRIDVFYRSILLRDGYLYVAGAQRGLDVIDVSNPRSPALLRNIPAEGPSAYPVQLSLSGNYLYVANLLGGLKIYSLSDPASPQLVRTVNQIEVTRDVAVLDGYAYVAYGTQGLAVADVHDPFSPSREVLFDINSGETATEAVFALSNPDRLYVADGKEGLKVFEPSADPMAYPPRLLWRFQGTVDVRDVHVLENPDHTRTAYLADYSHSGGGLWAVDVTGAGEPGFSPTPRHLAGIGYAKRLFVNGTWTYVASNMTNGIIHDASNGLYVVDSSGPSLVMCEWLKEGYEDIADVDAVAIGDRQYALVATNGGPSAMPGVVPPPPSRVHILLNSDCTLSEPLPPLEFQGHYYGDFMAAVEAAGERAYINHTNNGVYVYDLSPLGLPTPGPPLKLAFKKLTCNNSSEEIHLFDDFIYNAHGDSGLYILRFTP
jgi:hypothetical protein